MTRNLWTLLGLCGLLALPATIASTQQVGPPPIARDSLEARVRQRMGQILRTQLGLTDDQMRQLRASNRRFQEQKRALVEQEREVRMGLRDEIESGDTTRSAQISSLLDRMLVVQRKRVELMEAEQKDLATFLTPLQRARYFGMEEQINRRMTEMRDQGMRGAPPPGARRPPAGGVRPNGAAGVRRPPRR